MLQRIAEYIFLALMLIFMLAGLVSSVMYFRRMIDFQGAKKGLKQSVPFMLLAAISGAFWIYVHDPANWLSAICALVGSTAFIMVYYLIQTLKFSLVKKSDVKKYSKLFEFNKGDEEKKKHP